MGSKRKIIGKRVHIDGTEKKICEKRMLEECRATSGG